MIQLTRRDFLRLCGTSSIGLALAACGVTPTPTATPAPTNTALATSTPMPTATATATSTITSVPTTAPTGTPKPTTTTQEQFLNHLATAEAKQSIDQYASAFGLDSEQVKSQLTIQPQRDSKGNQFLVAITKNGTPLFIATQDQNSGEWRWERTQIKQWEFNVGTQLVRYTYERNPKIFSEFSSVSIDYDLSWPTIEPQQGTHIFTRQPNIYHSNAELFMDFALKNGMTITGSPLIYSDSYPDWLKSGKFSRDELIQIARNHIKTTVEHFKGKIKILQVMNQYHPARWGGKDVLRDGIGDELIEIAFQAARDADPSAMLIYSDSNNHAVDMSPDGLVIPNTMNIVDRLKSKSLIDGVGLHMHLDGSKPPSNQAVKKAMQGYGVSVCVTEFDVNMKDVPGDEAQRGAVQAKIYQDMVETSIESGVVRSFSLFGIGDQYSWLERPDNAKTAPEWSRRADPTPFDDNLQPKPAYYAIIRALFNKSPIKLLHSSTPK